MRKELEKAQRKNDMARINELSYVARNLAEKLAKESKDLFDNNEILGEDFHKMLLAIQNLIEYLNRNYLSDDNIEEEVSTMTKSLYDPEVEKRGIEQGMIISKKEDIIENLSELGEVTDTILFIVKNQNNLDILKKWLKLSIKSESIEVFMKAINI